MTPTVSAIVLAAVLLGYGAALGSAHFLLRLGFVRPPTQDRYETLDGLRGYLAISVAHFHFLTWFSVLYLGQEWGTIQTPILKELGSGSVALFFIATGFLFYPHIVKPIDRAKWASLIVGRVFRILPLTVFSVIIAAVIASRLTGQPLGLADMRSIGVWISGFGEPDLAGYPDSGRINAYVLWSIGYEWIFYLLMLPVVAVLLRIARPNQRFGLVFAMLLASWLISLRNPSHITIHILGDKLGAIWPFLPLFFGGMMIWEVSKNVRLSALVASRWFGWLALALFVATICTWPYPYGYGVPAFLMFLACVISGKHYRRILASPAARLLGEISFGVYLLHALIEFGFFSFVRSADGTLSPAMVLLSLPAVIAIVVFVAAATFLGIERPFIEAGNGIRRRINRRMIDA